MRQLGGSLGIAIMATMLARQTKIQKAMLTDHAGAYDPTTMERLNGITHGLMARGVDAWNAKQQALMMIDRQIGVQASVIAFSKIYLISGLLLVGALPLLLLWKTGKSIPIKMDH
jgi:DHA2 family multidrug resistance protein